MSETLQLTYRQLEEYVEQFVVECSAITNWLIVKVSPFITTTNITWQIWPFFVCLYLLIQRVYDVLNMTRKILTAAILGVLGRFFLSFFFPTSRLLGIFEHNIGNIPVVTIFLLNESSNILLSCPSPHIVLHVIYNISFTQTQPPTNPVHNMCVGVYQPETVCSHVVVS